MNHPVLKATLAAALVLCAPLAHAAPPMPAQVDRMLEAMDLETTLDGMVVQIEAATRDMGRSILGETATPEQRALFERVMAEQNDMMRQFMAPERLTPIYRSVYGELFTAEEVQAMTDFYASPAGRSILQKMPVAMGRAMQAMQPTVQEMMQQAQQTLERELKPAARP